jgi:hypothetical protein
MAMRRESSASPACKFKDSRGISPWEWRDLGAGPCPFDLDRGDEGPVGRKLGGEIARGWDGRGDREEEEFDFDAGSLVTRGDIVRRRRVNSAIGEDGGDGLVDAARLYSELVAAPRDVAEVDREGGEVEKKFGDAGEMLRLNAVDEDPDDLPNEARPAVCAGEEALFAAFAPDVAA